VAVKLRVLSPESFLVLYRQHERALRAFIGSRVHDAAVAEDLCQEVFLAVLTRGIPEPEGASGGDEAAAWLFGIARNKVLKHARDRKGGETLAADPASRAEAPSAGASESEERDRVRRAIAALETELRDVIALRYEGGLGAPAIAARLDLPVTTVEGRLKRAREALVLALVPPIKTSAAVVS
jgi:RNA polymerase sigma-70 factor (ECF subfamily)